MLSQKRIRFKSTFGIQKNHNNILILVHQMMFCFLFKDAVGLIYVDIEAALSKFTDGIRKAGHCMQRTVTVGKDKGSPWFDGECKK